MAKTKSNPKIVPESESAKQLACRATPRETALLTVAARLVARGNRNLFIVDAALAAARGAIKAHGISEDDVMAEFGFDSKKRA